MMPVIPADLPLMIPGSIPFFKFLLVVSFVLHILFVLITISGSVLSVTAKAIAVTKKKPEYDRMAWQLITSTSINKSIAVVLGVAPLLLISVLYTQFFYTSSVLMGGFWLSVIWLLILGFLLLYAYKFSWERLREHPFLHWMIGVLGTLCFLIVPMIFVATMSLMRIPDQWEQTQHFLQMLSFPAIWLRYSHFIGATLVFGGLLTVGIARYGLKNLEKTKKLEKMKEIDSQSKVRREDTASFEENQKYYTWMAGFGMHWTRFILALQILLGLLMFFAVPASIRTSFLSSVPGILTMAFIVIATASTFWLAWKNVAGEKALGAFRKVGIFLGLVLLLMATMRFQLRELQLQPYMSDNSSGHYTYEDAETTTPENTQ